MKVLIGCPVMRRDWCLPDWFDHVHTAATRAGVDYGFVFLTPGWDTATHTVIQQGTAGRPVTTVHTDEPDRNDQGGWDKVRYQHMVDLRNQLLGIVREQRPDRFLSLDSDIMAHPDVITNLIGSTAGSAYHAVGGACYMGYTMRRGQRVPVFPSYLRRRANVGGWERTEQHLGIVMRVDAIMAVKLMTPDAYDIDYRMHNWGEDIGWSIACTDAGLRLGWDNRVVSEHLIADKRRTLARG